MFPTQLSSRMPVWLTRLPDRALTAGWALAASSRRAFLAERSQWALWLPVGIGAGIALYFAMPVEPPLTLAVVGLVLLWSGWRVLPRETPWRAMLCGLLIICLGFTAAAWRSNSVGAPVIEKRLSTRIIDGVIERVERRTGASHRLTLRVLALEKHAPEDTPRRVRVSVRETLQDQTFRALGPGQTIRVAAVLMPPPGPAAPGAFDFARQAWFQGLGGVGYAVRPPEIREGPTPERTWMEAMGMGIASLRDEVTLRIRAGALEGTGGIAAAVITGDRSGIAQTDIDALRDAGLQHLLAISGLHMTAIAALIFFVVRAGLALVEPVALTQPVKKWAAAVTILGGAAYLLLSGASVSTQRAFIMVTIAMAALLADRPAISLRTVALAAMLILLFRPESLIHAGFQMSFAAVTALIAAHEAWARWRRGQDPDQGGKLPWLAGLVLGVAATTLIAGLATAPFAAFHFNRLGHYDLLANIFAVPLFSFLVMPMALFSLLLMPLGLEAWGLQVMGWGIKGILAVAHEVSGLPGAVGHVAAFPGWTLGLMVLGGLWLALWRGRIRLVGLAPLLAGLTLAALARGPDLIVDRDASLVAMRTHPGGSLTFHEAPRDDFTAGVWLRRDGDGTDPARAVSVARNSGTLTTGDRPVWICDGLGCAARHEPGPDREPFSVAFASTAGAHGEDCRRATVLVSAVPVRGPCQGPRIVIDRFTVWREGAVVVWFRSGAPLMRTARSLRGERPWVLPRLRKRRAADHSDPDHQ